ncbi:hypothetical protein ACGFMM_24535 [Streptomyces sp. NPDC048604]|uniref:hypothetical protein n=1 Tax=Streptomyces sp. NPDC048604 TaxID=3365578 RepID=UPI0037131539
MRSARILYATIAAAGTLALAAPGAYAATADDHGKDSSSHSQKDWEKGKDKKDWGKDKPKGGVHTGSGALSLVGEGDWEKDKDKKHWDKDKPKGGVHTGSGALSLVGEGDWEKDKDKKDWGKDHEKPKGGMHTGGGSLAGTGTNVTGGVVVAGALAAFVMYRRKQAAGTGA